MKENPYEILDLELPASGEYSDLELSAIKTAYRQKARETHPDKNPNKPAEEAAADFRRVQEAYELLGGSVVSATR